MSDEPGKIEETMTDAAKAVSVASAASRVVCWGSDVLSRLHKAIVSDSLSTAHRWRLNVQDFAKAHALVFWQAIGAGLLAVVEWVQAYVMPTLKAELNSSDWSKVAQVALLAAAVRLVVAMVQKGQQQQPPAVPPNQW